MIYVGKNAPRTASESVAGLAMAKEKPREAEVSRKPRRNDALRADRRHGDCDRTPLRGPPASEPYIAGRQVTLIWISGPRGCA